MVLVAVASQKGVGKVFQFVTALENEFAWSLSLGAAANILRGWVVGWARRVHRVQFGWKGVSGAIWLAACRPADKNRGLSTFCVEDRTRAVDLSLETERGGGGLSR